MVVKEEKNTKLNEVESVSKTKKETIEEKSIEEKEEIPAEDDYFGWGNKLYNEKAPLSEVIDKFLKAIEKNPKDSSSYTCLSWLHILRDEEGDQKKALTFAKTALKLDPTNSQAHFNLVLAFLTNNKKGVREEFQKVISKSSSQDIEAAITNLKEALNRRPDFEEAKKLLKWLENN